MDTKNEDAPTHESIEAATEAVTATIAPKADLVKRTMATIVDLLIAFFLNKIPIVGMFAGIGYILVRDGLEFNFIKHQSIGKKLVNLKAVRLDGEPMDIGASIRRNWMFALGTLAALVAWIPVLGFLAVLGAALLSLLIVVYEVYLVFTDSEGRRWGDTFAGTKVIEIDE